MLDASLQQHVQRIIPGARLDVTPLPACPQLSLLLLNADYPQAALDVQQRQRVMNNPLYWVFCWASGQVLARFLLDHPHWVRGKRVADFGCGSGVVAIAAMLAGAREAVACDNDPAAQSAARQNARLNGVEITVSPDFDRVEGFVDVIFAADVLYDRSNLSWLPRFIERAPQVLIADSRVKDFDQPPYREILRQQSFTLPDLDESAEFRQVRIYLAE
ncbi:MAG: methyltransferase [Halioglobus sp.]|nr:methyltransferase [Halioglobus sp.]